jgi:hypothetical protein
VIAVKATVRKRAAAMILHPYLLTAVIAVKTAAITE